MKITVIDGQDGRMGKAIIEILNEYKIEAEIIAIGTNGIATSAMLSAKADIGVTGENAVISNVKDSDYIIGSVDIITADSLYGEISPAMAVAVGQSKAKKILLPTNSGNIHIMGVEQINSIDDCIKQVVDEIEF